MTWSGLARTDRPTASKRKEVDASRDRKCWICFSFVNLPMLTKALIGSGVTLFILALVQLLNGQLLVGIDRSFSSFRDRTVGLETADAIERRFLELRQEARASALIRSDAAEANLSIALSNLRQAVDSGRAALTKPSHLESLDLLSRLLADYETRFRLSKKLRATQIAMTRDFLDDANEKIRDNLYLIGRLSALIGARESQLRALSGLESVMAAQLKAHQALDRPSDAAFAEAAQYFVGVTALVVALKTIATNPLIQPMHEDLRVATTRFAGSFEILSSIARLSDDLNNRSMVEAEIEIAAAIEGLRRDALQDVSAIANALSNRIQESHVANIAFSALALSLGALCAWLISVATAAPVVEMAGAMRRLAAGDKSVTPPALGRRDEIGEMASAVAVFKASMIEAERLARIEQQVTEEANRQLEEKVAERTRELERSRQELMDSLQRLTEAGAEIAAQQKMASLGRIVAGVAHEVNTPLGVAITACSSLAYFGEEFRQKVEARQCSQEDLAEFLETMIHGSDLLSENLGRAARLVNSFKQVSADQHIGEERRMMLGEHIRNIAASLEPEIRRRGHRLELTLDETLETTLRPDALWQIISNLVINALAHGLSKARPGRIGVSLATEAEMAVLRVSDNGAGIPQEIQENIFEPFFTTKRGQGGTGLGLSVVHTLATQTLGGRVACESAPGEGTVISVFFPLESKPALAEA